MGLISRIQNMNNILGAVPLLIVIIFLSLNSVHFVFFFFFFQVILITVRQTKPSNPVAKMITGYLGHGQFLNGPVSQFLLLTHKKIAEPWICSSARCPGCRTNNAIVSPVLLKRTWQPYLIFQDFMKDKLRVSGYINKEEKIAFWTRLCGVAAKESRFILNLKILISCSPENRKINMRGQLLEPQYQFVVSSERDRGLPVHCWVV